MQLAVALVRREVHDVDGQFLREHDGAIVAARLHRRLHAVGRPAEHILGQLVGPFETNAPVAHRSHVPREERFLIRVVEIDIVVVREQELHEPE